MLFNSLEFLIFFPVVTTLYFVLPHKLRLVLLLIASCLFYIAFIPAYILILFLLIGIDYRMAIGIEDSPQSKKKHHLITSIFATCTALFIFKYFNFFNSNFQAIAHLIGWNYPIHALEIILPIGLSFHTFQSLAYIIEVYKGNQKAERNFWIYSLYVMFYPQLVAGPIERPENLLHQFYEKHHFDYRRVTDGLKLMVWGMFKKVVIADRLAIYVNNVYDHPANFHGPAFFMAMVFFAFQIYCDFSGYSDMAIGAAQVMGFRLMTNFNRPYFARSTAELWKRWHISLSTWFFDYIYSPIAIAKRDWGEWSVVYALLITFFLIGLWHGADWKFVIFGLLQWVVLATEFLTRKQRKLIINKLPEIVNNCLGIFFTFGFFSIILTFFSARNAQDAIYFISQLPYGWHDLVSGKGLNEVCGIFTSQFLLTTGLIAALIIVEIVQGHGSISQMLCHKPTWIRWAFYYMVVGGIVYLGEFGSTPFIYFKF